ncbi:MAG: VCBS repeat-containing protein [Myxococcales bacterium]|nr:VCBS repeat-containing protein [Myxococcales bacterium]
MTSLTTLGCGDGDLCREAIAIELETPTGVINVDGNPELQGTQLDVVVTTNAQARVPLLLTVTRADGEEVTSQVLLAPGDGTATFRDVTVPSGELTFAVTAEAGACGRASDDLVAQIAIDANCTLALDPTPHENAFYAPRLVLRASDDLDAEVDDLQVDATLGALPGYGVEFIAVDGEGSEEVLHSIEAIEDEPVTARVTLRDGERTLFTRCTSPDAASDETLTPGESGHQALFVDNVAPTCEFTTPLAGSSITTAADKDDAIGNGLQYDLVLAVADADAQGESATISITPPGSTTAVDAEVPITFGQAVLEATFTDTGAEAWQLAATASDRAGNTCEAVSDLRVVFGGCEITATSAPTNIDANPGTAGVQVTANVQVAAACIGRTITSDCGSNDPGGVATGNNNFAVTVCAGSSCETQQTCTFRVTTAGGIETTDSVQLAFDNIAPAVALQLIAPPVSCGNTITAADDANPGLPGVQAIVRVLASLTTDRELVHTKPDTSTETLDGNVAGGEVTVTLEPGLNTFRGHATDTFGNAAQSALCSLTLADLAVSFSPPIADGLVGALDGTLSGGDLVLDICGTVSESGTAVEIEIDGGAALAAIENGNTWCVDNVALANGAHTIFAEATIGPRVGQATLALMVDLTPPPAVTAVVATPLTRQSLQLQWTAPSNVSDVAGYVIKASNSPINEGNFDALPVALTVVGAGAANSTQLANLASLRPGALVHLAVVAFDAASNRSTLASGSATLAFTKIGPAFLGFPIGDAALGRTMVSGRFNSDAFDDLAVAAPFEADGLGRVYVYFGSANGTAVTPGATLQGTEASAQFGNGLTAMRWSSATMDDLAVGSPLAGGIDGRIYIFEPGASGLAGTKLDTSAEVTINAAGGWFAFGAIGYTLTTARFDGDANDDLIIGAVAANGFLGGAAVIYGGTITGNVVDLDDTDFTGLGGAAVSIINNPNPAATDLFANYVHNVGKTGGASDLTDDLLIGYSDDVASASTTNNRVLLMRGTVARPADNTVAVRAFDVARDVIFDLDSVDTTTDFAAAASSIDDQNSDGARDVVISAFREGTGAVYVVDGNVLGNAQGIALLSNATLRLSRITGAAPHTLFGVAIANNSLASAADIDNDGLEDLVIAASTAPGAVYVVWYGGSIPSGNATSASANYVLPADASISMSYPNNGGAGGVLLWCDVNGDGLDDLALSSSHDNTRDGLFEVLTR